MKMRLLILSALMSFSAFVAGEQSGLRKLSSVPIEVKSKGYVSSKPMVDVDTGVSSIKREAVEKKSRKLNKLTQQKLRTSKTREKAPQKSAKAGDFNIYNAWTYLDYDSDNDGYYSEFTVNFDVNVIAGYADVYADMYLSKDGGPWIYFNTTEEFTIHASDSSDYYSVTTGLNFDFPTDYYDVLVDVYEVGYSGIVATAGPDEFNALFSLPLEDREHEVGSNAADISFVSSELSDDLDVDGYYTRLVFEFDVDTVDPGRLVYTEIQLINQSTNERFTRSTENFGLESQTEIVEMILEVGYRTAFYDVEIRLIDVATEQVLETAAQDFSALNDLPIESKDFDNRAGSSDGNGSVVIIEESGGGATGLVLLFLLGLLPLARRRTK